MKNWAGAVDENPEVVQAPGLDRRARVRTQLGYQGPGRSRPPMDKNHAPADGMEPVHVPFGHIVANEKWRGSQLAREIQGKIKLVFEDGLTVVDFYLSSRSCILYITEADLVAGNGYRKRLVRVRNVQEQTKEPSKNPFLRKKRAVLSEPFLLRTVQQIPGVGKVKALLLLQKFPSIQQLSNASIQELQQVVGQAVAQQIHIFFTQSRNNFFSQQLVKHKERPNGE
ncbi:Fanconi anemia core complex-associated protein 24 isoform X7 [Fukomys damarensis]|uniref:Fanconi anemia core complex-associated protein 24 isoform X7 n=1 Tax=Fukomys damarensis TaxID=885580 RepID=UPI001455C4A0|nr:Fanconi anemia core complex-associated protein 24 isoform X7 [Fukomys damarensis]